MPDKRAGMSASAASSATRRVGDLARQLSSPQSSSPPSLPDSPSALYGDCAPASKEVLAAERARATFDAREMTHFLSGGARLTAVRAAVFRQLEEGARVLPALRNVDEYEDDQAAQRRRTLERVKALYRIFMTDGGDADARNARVEIAFMYDPAWSTRNGVHFGLFVGALQSQGTDEQCAYWLGQAYALSIYGCFGMTELGHGSFVRGLETTATFVPGAGPDGAGEWDIHTPTITATKWWIGAAAETATHCSLYARLVTNGKDHGVHVFLVQLRDTETHALLPGVRAGDVGPKYGRNGIDNGWLQFHHARYPASVLLCRFAKVDADGTYVPAPKAKPQLAYGALVMGRASMVTDSAAALQLATTIAVRWNALRRQGAPFNEASAAAAAAKGGKGAGKKGDPQAAAVPGPEPQLLDYATTQARLMPLVAKAFAFTATAARMREMYDAMMAGLDNEDASALPDVHATSAGFKAFCTWAAYTGIDTCRQTLGGHGYSSYSRLPSLLADFAVMCTWEGDNTVMALQTARYLISSLAKAKAGQTLSGSVSYLSDKSLAPTCPATTADALLDPNVILAAMRWRARSAVLACAAQLDAAKKGGAGKPPLSDGEAWNACSVPLVHASKAHVYFVMASFFALAVARRRASEEERLPGVRYPGPHLRDPALKTTAAAAASSAAAAAAASAAAAKRGNFTTGQASSSSSSVAASAAAATPTPGANDIPVTGPLYPVLKALCDLFALSHVQEDLAGYFRGGYFSAAQAGWVDAHVSALCTRTRADAVPLVDSFAITDFVLNSPLGRYDGDVYRHYMATVQSHGAGAGRQVGGGGTITAASGPPALLGSAARVPIPVPEVRAPYFEELIKPMLEGDAFAAGPIEGVSLVPSAAAAAKRGGR
jgi:acyl-CoA oxidase